MKIAVFGTGYVGLVTGTCFADTGHDVICVDIDAEKIRKLNDGISPIYEPGLDELIRKNTESGRLRFVTDAVAAIHESLFLFIAVGTPPGEDGSADLTHVLAVARTIGEHINGYKVVVVKSTVPVGTCDRVREAIRAATSHDFDVVSNPEFLKEGTAVEDCLMPERIIVGTDNIRTAEIMKALYAPFVRTGNPIYVLDVRSSETTKYAANAMLATRISFMNEFAGFCERMGADIDAVRTGIGSDSRIGKRFLFAGVGYGGSCFPKDVQAVIRMAHKAGFSMPVLEAAEAVNNRQKALMAERVIAHFGGGLAGRKIAVWGLSFKPKTDDMREAPSITIIRSLLDKGAAVSAHDPIAMEVARGVFGDAIEFCANNYDALQGADALVVVTEWNDYRFPDFQRMKTLMRNPVIFDGRNVYNPLEVVQLGFSYYGIGRLVPTDPPAEA
ncbi:MAG TPA: UDP-glucose/GDP-mannose dehydrogenase family protein [Acidobacteriota bacterium]|nr:UDP-glucose/GDP-mannose dehydrogenase family protein [Acidobacteriota bacterium]HQM64042.1 UDP-glucose/GDP-mannose dehydrogenase family protein [Acidobacteriota bacterium]